MVEEAAKEEARNPLVKSLKKLFAGEIKVAEMVEVTTPTPMPVQAANIDLVEVFSEIGFVGTSICLPHWRYLWSHGWHILPTLR